MTTPTIEDMMSWPAPNYVNPDTRKALLLAVEIPCTAVMTIFVFGRFYSKVSRKLAVCADDWVMLTAWVSTLFH
jgi:hypothetical protein